jgi:hypothetical protein
MKAHLEYLLAPFTLTRASRILSSPPHAPPPGILPPGHRRPPGAPHHRWASLRPPHVLPHLLFPPHKDPAPGLLLSPPDRATRGSPPPECRRLDLLRRSISAARPFTRVLPCGEQTFPAPFPMFLSRSTHHRLPAVLRPPQPPWCRHLYLSHFHKPLDKFAISLASCRCKPRAKRSLVA